MRKRQKPAKFVPIQQSDLQRTISFFEIRTDSDLLLFENKNAAWNDPVYLIVRHYQYSGGQQQEVYNLSPQQFIAKDNNQPLSVLYDEQWASVNEAKQAVATVTGQVPIARSTRIAYIVNSLQHQAAVYRDMYDSSNSTPWAYTTRAAGIVYEQKGFTTRRDALAALNQYTSKLGIYQSRWKQLFFWR